METKTMIPQIPYFSGMGWTNKWNEFMELHFTKEEVSQIRTEGTVMWNRTGGSPSGYYKTAASNAIRQRNADEELTFPYSQWADEQAKIAKLQRAGR